MRSTSEARARVRARTVQAMAAASAIALLGAAPSGQAETASTKGFRKGVTLQGIREHQAAFQAHADAIGGNRVAGSAGYDASAAYVKARAQAAGLVVTEQEFSFPYVGDATPPVLARLSPAPFSYVDGVDYGSMQYSGSGDVTAPVVAVDLVLPPPPGPGNANTSGCEAADFAGFPAGAIALVQRGTCTFRIKADNALAAGAVAVIVFNEGQPGRTAGAFGTLGLPPFGRPVVSASFAVGVAFAGGVLNGPTGTVARVRTDTTVETRTTVNLIAETPTGDPGSVIVVGAHLDSVSRGPGINDNGSGSAAILEIAETFMAQGREARNRIRFMWYGAEELGLVGSTAYVNGLSPSERGRIAAMLNFDMIGSPNYVRFVYDGDNSAFPVGPGAAAGPAGSGEIERIFRDYFAAEGLASAETPFSGRSDYGPFIAVGIPAGGLFTGAEGLKTAAEAAEYGGTAGQPYDPCYHLRCDTYVNNSDAGLDEMADAAAHAVLSLSRRDLGRQPLVDPAVVPSNPGDGGGGGLHDDHDHDAKS